MPLVSDPNYTTKPRRNDTRLVHGVAICDVRSVRDDGKNKPAYEAWKNMLQRCYLPAYHGKFPTYAGCSVCAAWLTFSVFEAWYEANYRPGLQLDKDILKPGNKVYCPKYCRFVPHAVNSLFGSHRRVPGNLPQGVSRVTGYQTFAAKVQVSGKQVYCGLFSTVVAAAAQYVKSKQQAIREIADLELRAGTISSDVHKALYRRARLRIFTSSEEIYAVGI